MEYLCVFFFSAFLHSLRQKLATQLASLARPYGEQSIRRRRSIPYRSLAKLRFGETPANNACATLWKPQILQQIWSNTSNSSSNSSSNLANMLAWSLRLRFRLRFGGNNLSALAEAYVNLCHMIYVSSRVSVFVYLKYLVWCLPIFSCHLMLDFLALTKIFLRQLLTQISPGSRGFFVPKDRWVQVPWTTSRGVWRHGNLETSLPFWRGMISSHKDVFEHFEHFSVYYQQFHVWREGRISNMINVFIERGWVGICLWAILSPALGLNTFWIFLRSLLEIANEVWATCIHATVIVSGFFAPLRYVPWLHLSPWGNALDVNVPTLGAVTLKGKFH